VKATAKRKARNGVTNYGWRINGLLGPKDLPRSKRARLSAVMRVLVSVARRPGETRWLHIRRWYRGDALLHSPKPKNTAT
jgi:hypothetical protein